MLESIIHDPKWVDKITEYFRTGVTPTGTEQVEVHDADNALFIYVDRDIAGEDDKGIWIVTKGFFPTGWSHIRCCNGWGAAYYEEYFGDYQAG